MKKILTILSVVTLFTTIAIMQIGCKKSSSNSASGTNVPDISNFSIQSVSTFVAGAPTLVSVVSKTLADGSYTMHFDMSGANNLVDRDATMVFSAGSGTFLTPMLANAGNTNITINSISSSSGGNNAFGVPVTKQFTDSTGLITCKINGVDYRTTHVFASLVSGMGILELHCESLAPLTTITIDWIGYSGTTGSRYFNLNDLDMGSLTSSDNGHAFYDAPGITRGSAHGNLTVSTISTGSITGTFQFTCSASDSIRITNGAFSCKLK